MQEEAMAEMLLQDVIQHSKQHSFDDISTPIPVEMLDFCDHGDVFSEALCTSDVSSCSPTGNCGTAITTTATNTVTTSSNNSLSCYDEGSFGSDFSPFPPMDAATLSALLDPEQPPDPEQTIVPATPTPTVTFVPYLGEQPDQIDQLILSDAMEGGYSSYTESAVQLPLGAPQQQQLLTLHQAYEGCLPPLPVGYMDPSTPTSCSFLDAGSLSSFYTAGMAAPLCGTRAEGQMGFFAGMMTRSESGVGIQELPDYQRTDSIGAYTPESICRVYSSSDFQVIGDGATLVHGCNGGARTTLPASDISSLDDSTFKVGRLSVEERKEKIHRYLKKRNERNFSKKIKYACRKTLADSRPRVRGRFAKNDEYRDTVTRTNSSHHEFDDEEEVVIKEEKDMLNSSDILAHISGVNSLKYNYILESWI